MKSMFFSSLPLDTISDSVVSNTVASLKFAVSYDAPSQKLKIRLMEIADIGSGGSARSPVAVELALLPRKKFHMQRHRRTYRSKFYTIPAPIPTPTTTTPSRVIVMSPQDKFTFRRVDPEDVIFHSLQFQLVRSSSDRLPPSFLFLPFSRKRVLGEGVLPLCRCKPINQEKIISLELESPSRNQFAAAAAARHLLRPSHSHYDKLSLSLSEASSSGPSQGASLSSRTSQPEILIGLAYRIPTGSLSVKIIQAAQLDAATMHKSPDTCVKLILYSVNGQELARNKTHVIRGCGNPRFSQEFLFSVPLFQLGEVSLLVYVYQRLNLKRKILIGWTSFGQRGSTEEELHHWNEMSETELEIKKWHPLHFT